MRRQIRSWMRPVNPLKAHAQPLITELGRNVRSRRAAAGLSQLELARLADISDRFLLKIERGQSNPSVETLALVARALGCSVPDLLTPAASYPQGLARPKIGPDDAQ